MKRSPRSSRQRRHAIVLLWLGIAACGCSAGATRGARDGATDANTGGVGGAGRGDDDSDSDASSAGSGGSGGDAMSTGGHAAADAGGAGDAASDAGFTSLSDAGVGDTCPGYATDTTAPVCRSAADCNADAPECLLAEPPVVGGARPPDCSNHPCMAGTVCVINRFEISCVAPCDAAGAPACVSGVCAPGDRFADVLGCRPVTCSDPPTFACGPTSKCDPAQATSRDAVGCVRLPCDTNSDCPCGTCMDGVCYEHPFHCFLRLFAP